MPIIYSNLLYKMGQDFLDIQYCINLRIFLPKYCDTLPGPDRKTRGHTADWSCGSSTDQKKRSDEIKGKEKKIDVAKKDERKKERLKEIVGENQRKLKEQIKGEALRKRHSQRK